jgi:hypothetical protein
LIQFLAANNERRPLKLNEKELAMIGVGMRHKPAHKRVDPADFPVWLTAASLLRAFERQLLRNAVHYFGQAAFSHSDVKILAENPSVVPDEHVEFAS